MTERRQGENYDRKTVRHLAKQMRGWLCTSWCSPVEEPTPFPSRMHDDEGVPSIPDAEFKKLIEAHSYSSNGYVGTVTSEHLVVFQLEYADCRECIAKALAAQPGGVIVLRGELPPMEPGTKLEFVPDDDEAALRARIKELEEFVPVRGGLFTAVKELYRAMEKFEAALARDPRSREWPDGPEVVGGKPRR